MFSGNEGKNWTDCNLRLQRDKTQWLWRWNCHDSDCLKSVTFSRCFRAGFTFIPHGSRTEGHWFWCWAVNKHMDTCAVFLREGNIILGKLQLFKFLKLPPLSWHRVWHRAAAEPADTRRPGQKNPFSQTTSGYINMKAHNAPCYVIMSAAAVLTVFWPLAERRVESFLLQVLFTEPVCRNTARSFHGDRWDAEGRSIRLNSMLRNVYSISIKSSSLYGFD